MTPEIRYLVKEQAKGTNHTNDRDRLKVEEDPVLLPVGLRTFTDKVLLIDPGASLIYQRTDIGRSSSDGMQAIHPLGRHLWSSMSSGGLVGSVAEEECQAR
jgi:hypothetical protein